MNSSNATNIFILVSPHVFPIDHSLDASFDHFDFGPESRGQLLDDLKMKVHDNVPEQFTVHYSCESLCLYLG